MGWHVRMVIVSMATWALAGCTGDLTIDDGADPPIGGPDAGIVEVTPMEQMFLTNVEPAIAGRGCVACHTQAVCEALGSGNCFLATPPGSNYAVLKASPQFGTSPATTSFLNQGGHENGAAKAFCGGVNVDADGNEDLNCQVNQVAAITQWINLENQ